MKPKFARNHSTWRKKEEIYALANYLEDRAKKSAKNEDNDEIKEQESSIASTSPMIQKDNDSEYENDQKNTDATASTEWKGSHQDSKYDTGHSINTKNRKLRYWRKAV